ncbi:MAG: hypothetical protein LBJ04_04180 [Sphingobacterium sp.]|nr:hypothetical protein [Sphingobacterium sp.]
MRNKGIPYATKTRKTRTKGERYYKHVPEGDDGYSIFKGNFSAYDMLTKRMKKNL